MSDPQTKVLVYQHGKLVCENDLPPGEYVVGRDGVAEVCAPGNAVDGPKLHLHDGDCRVEDQGSMDGTMVDGETVSVPTIIMPGQVIRHGDQEIRVFPPGSSEIAAEPEPERPAVTVRQPSVEEIRNPHRYVMARRIGRGGMGVVMSARDLVLQREVAMKLMLDGTTKPEAVARFHQEAQITAQLEHPNIVPVHALDLDAKDQPFYTMKLVRGISLKKVIEGLANDDGAMIRQWPLSALLTVFQKICDAIAFAHARGVIHRDLKPDNILLGEYGEVQVMDWGLAKVLGQDSATGTHQPISPEDPVTAETGDKTTLGATMSGTVIGTPQYMSPEQAKGAVELLDEQTDIYSLGAILYHILALRAPFNGHSTDEVLRHVRVGRIIPLEDAGVDKKLAHIRSGRVPESLAAVSEKAMKLEKTQRYPAVKILQKEIQAYQNGFATSAEDAGFLKLASLFFRRHRTLSWAAVAFVIATVAFGFNLKQEKDRATTASIQAQAARRTADLQRDAAEDQLYLSEMLQAGRHLADGRPESARDLLARHRREPSGRDLRHWEWFYLLGEANQDRLRVHAHAGGVFSVAATADGARLATGGGDGDVAVWQTRGLVPEFRLHASPAAVLSVDWHVGGRLLAAGCADGLVRVWDVTTRQSVAEFRTASETAVRSVRWRPENAGPPTLVFGGTDQEIVLWTPQASGQEGQPRIFEKLRGGIAALSWSADGERLAVGELHTVNTVEVFNFPSRSKALSDNTRSGNDAFTVAIDPTGRYVAAGSKHLAVAVYELNIHELIGLQALHRGFVSALAWSPDARKLASASHDGTIRISSPLEPKDPVQILSGHEGEVNTLLWLTMPALSGSDKGTTALYSGGADGTLRAWNPTVGHAFTVREHNWIAAANWNPTGTRLAVVDFRDNVCLCDPDSGLSMPLHTAHGNLFDVAWSPDGTRLATASRERNRVETFDAASGRPLGIYGLPSAYRVAWSPSGRYLAAGGLEGARVWDTKTAALVVVISRPVGSLQWHPDERHLVLGADDGAVELWEAFTGKMTATWRPATVDSIRSVTSETEPPRQVYDLRWSPDRRFLAFGTQDSVAGIFDVHEGRLARTLTGNTGGIWRVVWNADGRRLATVGQDGMLRLYDAATGGQVAHIHHGLGNTELQALDWSGDGTRLVSGGFDVHVRLWDERRGRQIDAIGSAPLSDQAPTDGETLRTRFRQSVQLGWADEAREILQVARKAASDDPTWTAASAAAEAQFARALDVAPAEGHAASGQAAGEMALLKALDEAWEGGQADVAVQAWRTLASRPGAEASLAFARTYLSRARWSATWFPSTVDPVSDLDGWRKQAKGIKAVTADVRTLCFPYRRRGPSDLFLNASLTERGPGSRNFGMIARARVNLAAGKWRFRVVGGDGARVLAGGQVVVENWGDAATLEKAGEFEQAATGPVDLTVEHYVREGTDDFQFLLEPAGP